MFFFCQKRADYLHTKDIGLFKTWFKGCEQFIWCFWIISNHRLDTFCVNFIVAFFFTSALIRNAELNYSTATFFKNVGAVRRGMMYGFFSFVFEFICTDGDYVVFSSFLGLSIWLFHCCDPNSPPYFFSSCFCIEGNQLDVEYLESTKKSWTYMYF